MTIVTPLKLILLPIAILAAVSCSTSFSYCILGDSGETVCCVPGDSTAPECTVDLVVDELTVRDISRTRQEVRFDLTARVEDLGPGADSAPTLRFYLSPDSVITDDDEVLQQTTERSISVTAPDTPGTYYYGACVEAGSDDKESDTTNNCSAAVIWFVVEDGPPEDRPRSAENIRFTQDGQSLRVEWDPSPGATHYRVYEGTTNRWRSEINCEMTQYEDAGPTCEVAGNLTSTTYLPDERRWSSGTSFSYKMSTPKAKVVDRTSTSLTLELTGWGPVTRHYLITACNHAGCSPMDQDNISSFETETYFKVRRLTGTYPGGGYYLSKNDPVESVHPPGKSRENPYRHNAQGLLPDADHHFLVWECDLAGCSNSSDLTAGRTEADGPVEVPLSPVLQGEKIEIRQASDYARVSWEPVETATYYELWKGSRPDLPFELAEEISAPLEFQSFSTPVNRKTFGEYSLTSWKVRACNQAGCSPFSNIVTIR